MSTLQSATTANAAILHVFSQDGGWHWGITVQRDSGYGFRVVAYNKTGFEYESDAAEDGGRVLSGLAVQDVPQPAVAVDTPDRIAEKRRTEYIRERGRCAMKRLVDASDTDAIIAAYWVKVWGAALGERSFQRRLRREHRISDRDE